MAPSGTAHIYLDDQGRAWIDDTNVKVIEVAAEKLAWDFSPESIHRQHPHLSLAQIHAALSYYYDHKEEIDTELKRLDQDYETLLEQKKDSPVRQKLRGVGQHA